MPLFKVKYYVTYLGKRQQVSGNINKSRVFKVVIEAKNFDDAISMTKLQFKGDYEGVEFISLVQMRKWALWK